MNTDKLNRLIRHPLTLVIAAIVVIGIVVTVSRGPSDGTGSPLAGGNVAAQADFIRVTNLTPGDLAVSPLTIQGEARGTWFFEGSFPVSLRAEDGTVIAAGHAQASGEWMTESFVPFRAELSFTLAATTSDRGFLVLAKDNPSGLPEFDDELRFPVTFRSVTIASPSPTPGLFVGPPSLPSTQPPTSSQASPPPAGGSSMTAQGAATVKVFFGNPVMKRDPDVCRAVVPVIRVIPSTPQVGTAALRELLKGPTPAEVGNGYLTNLNLDAKLLDLTIEGGVARANFSAELDRAVGGSCRVAAIRAQITETLKQFPTVRDVVIAVLGRTEDVLQP